MADAASGVSGAMACGTARNGVSVSAAIEPAGSLPRSEDGKLRRLVDNRSL